MICDHDVAETTSIRENKEENKRSRRIKGKRIGREEYTTSQGEFPD
jgi:hypothetical protein